MAFGDDQVPSSTQSTIHDRRQFSSSCDHRVIFLFVSKNREEKNKMDSKRIFIIAISNFRFLFVFGWARAQGPCCFITRRRRPKNRWRRWTKKSKTKINDNVYGARVFIYCCCHLLTTSSRYRLTLTVRLIEKWNGILIDAIPADAAVVAANDFFFLMQCKCTEMKFVQRWWRRECEWIQIALLTDKLPLNRKRAANNSTLRGKSLSADFAEIKNVYWRDACCLRSIW